MDLLKEKGYVLGLVSVLCCVAAFFCPFLSVLSGAEKRYPVFKIIFMLMFAILPLAAYVLAFIGKKNSRILTKARSLCNTGAGISLVVTAIIVWVLVGALFESFGGIGGKAATITGLIDGFLVGFWMLMSYTKGKVLWFL